MSESPLTDRAAQRALVDRYVRERPAVLLIEPSGPTLMDLASGKTLPLDWGRISHVAEGKNSDTGAPFLALLRDDGRQVILADVGIAFAPVTAGTGPLPGLPPVVCFRDFAASEARLLHYLRDHPDDEVTRAHLDLFFFLLAVLDGARAVGFDVSREERRLEALLKEIESRRAPGA